MRDELREPYDWNRLEPRRPLVRPGVTFLDETLRDGIQNPSVQDPRAADKLELIHRMDDLGIDYVNVGLPAASARTCDDALAACREIAAARLRILPVAAGRTVVSDLMPIVEIAQKAGAPVGVYTFIGSSPIRQMVESWDVAWLVERSAKAVRAAVDEGMTVCFVTEDTTRSRPEALAELWRSALGAGATRLCLTDTVGYVTPDGARNLVRFVKSVTAAAGFDAVGIDWHGHNDRGLALDNALSALEHGADRVHATALGVGERCGNVPMELLLHNLQSFGEIERAEPERLARYCDVAAKGLGWTIPEAHPVVGSRARAMRERAAG